MILISTFTVRLWKWGRYWMDNVQRLARYISDLETLPCPLNIIFNYFWLVNKADTGHSILEDYKYTFEQNRDWTPYNSNLHMQGIKVNTKEAVTVLSSLTQWCARWLSTILSRRPTRTLTPLRTPCFSWTWSRRKRWRRCSSARFVVRGWSFSALPVLIYSNPCW